MAVGCTYIVQKKYRDTVVYVCMRLSYFEVLIHIRCIHTQKKNMYTTTPPLDAQNYRTNMFTHVYIYIYIYDQISIIEYYILYSTWNIYIYIYAYGLSCCAPWTLFTSGKFPEGTAYLHPCDFGGWCNGWQHHGANWASGLVSWGCNGDIRAGVKTWCIVSIVHAVYGPYGVWSSSP